MPYKFVKELNRWRQDKFTVIRMFVEREEFRKEDYIHFRAGNEKANGEFSPLGTSTKMIGPNGEFLYLPMTKSPDGKYTFWPLDVRIKLNKDNVAGIMQGLSSFYVDSPTPPQETKDATTDDNF